MPGILIENNSVNGSTNDNGIYAVVTDSSFTNPITVQNNVVIGSCTNGNYMYSAIDGSAGIIMQNNASEDDSLPIDENAPPDNVTRYRNFNDIDTDAEFLSITIEEYPDQLTSDYLKIKLGTASISVSPDKGPVPLDVIMTPTALVNILADHGDTNVDTENDHDLDDVERPNTRGRISIGVYEP